MAQKINQSQINEPLVQIAARGVGYGLTARLVRSGNIVTWNMNSTTASIIPAGDSIALGETIPLGYRPAAGTQGNPVGIVAVGVAQRLGWHIISTGSMTYSNTGATSGSIRVYSTGTWITDNPWP